MLRTILIILYKRIKKSSSRSEQERKRSNSQSDSSSGKGLPHQLRLGPDDAKKESNGEFHFSNMPEFLCSISIKIFILATRILYITGLFHYG